MYKYFWFDLFCLQNKLLLYPDTLRQKRAGNKPILFSTPDLHSESYKFNGLMPGLNGSEHAVSLLFKLTPIYLLFILEKK